MTTAARPTFNPRKGESLNAIGITHQISSRDMTGYTKMKWRDVLNMTMAIPNEESTFEKKSTVKSASTPSFSESLEFSKSRISGDINQGKEMKEGLGFEPRELLRKKKDYFEQDEDEVVEKNDASDEEGEEEEGEEEETLLLMKELERIKKERLEEKEKKEQSLLYSNPLLQNPLSDDATQHKVKRRWNEDVIFRNQSKSVSEKSTPRFINDTLRSEFHQKFLQRYIH
jgi:protein CWC15